MQLLFQLDLYLISYTVRPIRCSLLN